MPQRGQAVPNAEASSRVTITIILPGFIDTVANDITANWLRIEDTFELTDSVTAVHFVAKTVPASAIKVDIKKSTNDGSSFSTILSTPMTFTGHVTDLTPTWAGGDLEEGDLLRVDITQKDDSCSGVFIQLRNA